MIAKVTRTLVVLWLLMFTVVVVWPTTPMTPASVHHGSDADTFRRVAEEMGSGRSYYAAMGQALRESGYPTASPFNWRPPLLFLMSAHLPAGMQWLFLPSIIAILLIAWPLLGVNGRFAVTAGMTNVLIILLDPVAGYFTEAWAGIFIGLSLACHFRNWRTVSIALAAVACLFRELAGLYLLVCLIGALRERRRDELYALLVAAVVLAAYYLWHWRHVELAIRPGAPIGPSWIGFGGMRFIRSTLYHTVAGMFVVIPLAWAIGLSTIAAEIPGRLKWTIWAYACAFLIVGRMDNAYWGLLMNPAHGLALGYLPTLWNRHQRTAEI